MVYNILGDKNVSISYLLWFDTITLGSILLNSNIVFLKREIYEPILTVKRIEWRKFIYYFGLIIKANPSRVKKNDYFFHIRSTPSSLSVSSIYQGTI